MTYTCVKRIRVNVLDTIHFALENSSVDGDSQKPSSIKKPRTSRHFATGGETKRTQPAASRVQKFLANDLQREALRLKATLSEESSGGRRDGGW